MSSTTSCVPCSQPGGEFTQPSPIAMQQIDPGGVRRTTRRLRCGQLVCRLRAGGYDGVMWLFWLLLFAALLSLLSIFAFPGAVPIIAIVVIVVCLINAPLALRAARNKTRDRDDDSIVRNRRGEITDLGYRDKEHKVRRTQRAVFFGTPEWERYKRAKQVAEH